MLKHFGLFQRENPPNKHTWTKIESGWAEAEYDAVAVDTLVGAPSVRVDAPVHVDARMFVDVGKDGAWKTLAGTCITALQIYTRILFKR